MDVFYIYSIYIYSFTQILKQFIFQFASQFLSNSDPTKLSPLTHLDASSCNHINTRLNFVHSTSQKTSSPIKDGKVRKMVTSYRLLFRFSRAIQEAGKCHEHALLCLLFHSETSLR